MDEEKLKEIVNEIIHNFWTIGSWGAHAYAFEIMDYVPLISYMKSKGLDTARLEESYRNVVHEFDNATSAENKRKLEELDEIFLDQIMEAVSEIVTMIGEENFDF